jgi:hypothetical protein
MAPGTTQLAVMRSAASVRQRAGEADQARLGGYHMGATLGADMRAQAADIDDGAAVLLERRQAGLRAVEGAVEGDAEHATPFVIRHLAERLLAAQRRVVDEAVDALEARERRFGQACRGLRVGDIADMGGGAAATGFDLGDDGVCFRPVSAHVHHHGGAGFS